MPKTLLCLHGWGGSSASFTELRDALKNDDVEVLCPDLPGFGKEPEPRTPYSVDDYAMWVEQYIQKNISGEYLLLGHSHGGRIAIKLINRNRIAQPTHLFLCAAAGIRHPRHIKRIIGLMLAKVGKVLFSVPGLRALEPTSKKLLYKLVRVHDYEKASEVMRKTLIQVTQEDLRPLLSQISVQTDLFWGTDDGMTPYTDAIIMEKTIPKATLHTYQGVHHRVHRDRAVEIADVIRTHLS